MDELLRSFRARVPMAVFLRRSATLAVGLLLALAHATAHAAGRVALVVGNGAYAHTRPLANPVNDAVAVGAALERIGFDVTLLENADEDAMDDALGAFEEASVRADVALLFYAGHGMEMNGANYLVPVDARLASAAAVNRETIALDSVLSAMAGARTRIVILDACRNNPFARSMRGATRANVRSGGLAPVASGEGLLVAYAAAAGAVAADGDGDGENSPYTTVLLRHLGRREEVRIMLGDVGAEVMARTDEQQPFVYSSLSGRHYLAGGEVVPPPPPPPGDEDLLWQSALNVDTVAGYLEYERRYPNGRYVVFSRARVAALRPDPPDPVRTYVAGEVFRDDCPACPEMVVVPAGTFMMGSPASEEGRFDDEGPRHEVTLGSFAMGVKEVTFDEWEACVRGGGCGGYRPDDRGWGRGARPVINVSWADAQAYVRWLSESTGAEYRLPSESEWEYAARAGTATPFHTGSTISTDQANYGWNRGRTTPVGTFAPNAFGLYDVHGNVWEWVEDCWHGDYRGAPSDGTAWTAGGDCGRRVLRGGSWNDDPRIVRSALRDRDTTGNRFVDAGFRVSRTLD